MTPRQWTITGWVLIAAAALLAAVSVSTAFVALSTVSPLLAGAPAAPSRTFLLAVVLGVLAGVAFFSGLACFFWSAAERHRERLDAILRRLDAGPGPAARP